MSYNLVLLYTVLFCLLTFLSVYFFVKLAERRLKKVWESEIYFLTYLIPTLEDLRDFFPTEKQETIDLAIIEFKDRKNTLINLNCSVFNLRGKKHHD